MTIFTFDTTLRDGTQGEAVSFPSTTRSWSLPTNWTNWGSTTLRAAGRGRIRRTRTSSPARSELKLKHARLTAFGATRFAKNTVEEDPSVNALIEAGTPVVSIFGKSWDLHVHARPGHHRGRKSRADLRHREVSEGSRQGSGLRRRAFLRRLHAPIRDFALRTLEAAQESRRRCSVPVRYQRRHADRRLAEICADVRKNFDGMLGIHTHNDSELAVANALAAVEQGFTHVQGCINGYGERCGNANLASIIANLELKLGHTTIGPEKLTHLTAAARFIAELANLPMRSDQPYVGHSAFAHKGGVHVSAVLKDSTTYEHISPKLVGNRQRVLLSDLSGKGNILYKLKQHGLGGPPERKRAPRTAGPHQADGVQGYELEAAEGTFELLVREALHPGLHFFDVVGYEVTTTSAVRQARAHRDRELRAQDGVHSGHGQRPRPGSTRWICACANASPRSIRRSPTCA